MQIARVYESVFELLMIIDFYYHKVVSSPVSDRSKLLVYTKWSDSCSGSFSLFEIGSIDITTQYFSTRSDILFE